MLHEAGRHDAAARFLARTQQAGVPWRDAWQTPRESASLPETIAHFPVSDALCASWPSSWNPFFLSNFWQNHSKTSGSSVSEKVAKTGAGTDETGRRAGTAQANPAMIIS